MVFGAIVANRSLFPAHLAAEERANLLDCLRQAGHQAVILGKDDTELGAVAGFEDAQKCASLFRKNGGKLEGIIVLLPNFGEGAGVAEAIRLSGIHLPVLVVACDDSEKKMDPAHRRDAFCGKISLCSRLYQYGIPYTETSTHTCKIRSVQFSVDLAKFAAVCRVVNGVRHARIGVLSTRPNAFQAVRYSEKLLEGSGISIMDTDFSEIRSRAEAISGNGCAVAEKIREIRAYGRIAGTAVPQTLARQAGLCIAFENWVRENNCDAVAVQCRDSIRDAGGYTACLAMSMTGEKGIPCACGADIAGALTMFTLYLASGSPPGYLTWSNNFGEDRDRCVCLHCSNFPKSFFGGEFEITGLGEPDAAMGAQKPAATCEGQIAPGPVTFAAIITDGRSGKIKAYMGEGEALDDPVDTRGGVALCRIPRLQELMEYICKNGFDCHAAMCRSQIAGILREAFENYLGWEVYRHGGDRG